MPHNSPSLPESQFDRYYIFSASGQLEINFARNQEFLAAEQAAARQKARFAARYDPRGHYVTREFRDFLLSEYPQLIAWPILPVGAPNPRDRFVRLRLFSYILHTAFIDHDTHMPVIPFQFVRDMAGLKATTAKFKASDYLTDFNDNVFPLMLEEYSYVNGKARTAEMGLPQQLMEQYRHSQRVLLDPEASRVDLVTGKIKGRKERRQEHFAYLEEKRQEGICIAEKRSPQQYALNLLNSQSDGIVERQFMSKISDARRCVDTMPALTVADRRRIDHCHRILDGIQRHPIMVYKASEYSDRVYTTGATIHQLPRMLRKFFLADSHSFGCDLRNAQLAIVAKLWDMPQLHSFLTKGDSAWPSLLEWLDLEKKFKPVLKEASFAIAFGMSKDHIRELVTSGGKSACPLPQDRVDRYFEHWMIQELFTHREIAGNRVYASNGTPDAFEGCIPNSTGEAHRVLARQAQSFEFRLMQPILRELEELGDRCTILSFLHDGLTVHCTDRERLESIPNRLKRVLNREALALDIPTVLEIESETISVDGDGNLVISSGNSEHVYIWESIPDNRPKSRDRKSKKRKPGRRKMTPELARDIFETL